MLLALSIAKIAGLLLLVYILARPLVKGAVYFPTRARAIEAVKRLAAVKRGEKIIDLGSGDGRMLIAFGREGVEAHGYEIDPILVLWSRRKIKKAGLGSRTFVHWKSFWKVNLSPFDVVLVYGIPYIMGALQAKFDQELKPGARVLSNIYELRGWQPVAQENGVYLYIKQ